jgi:DNA polymerase-3 subunit delta
MASGKPPGKSAAKAPAAEQASGGPKPVHALVGSDVFLQLEALRGLMALAPKDVQRVDVDGDTAELAAVLDELRSFAMFSSAKMVVMRNADTWITRFREPLEKYLAHASSSGTLVLRCDSLRKDTRVYKAVAALGGIHECSPPKDLVKWIMDRGRRAHQLNIGTDAAGLLADFIGADLGRLDNELAKLALQTEGKPVNAESISTTVAFQREQEMWDLTNELADGQVTAAVDRWRKLMQTDPSAEFRAVTWLGMWLEDVRSYLAVGSGFRNAWKYRPRMTRFAKTAESIGKGGARRLLELLAELDYRSKSGLGEMAENVERFLLTMAAPR